MAKTKAAGKPRQPATVPDDEFRGQGGSYVIDPETGLRRLVERTLTAEEAEAAAEEAEAAAEKETGDAD